MDVAVDPKADCEALLRATMPFARTMLAEEGAFLPFGAQMLGDGEIVSVGADNGEEHPLATDLLDLIHDSFVAGAADGTLKATALAVDVIVTLPGADEKSPAIAVFLDHRDDYSVKVIYPYVLVDGKETLGDAFASEGDYAIFRQIIH